MGDCMSLVAKMREGAETSEEGCCAVGDALGYDCSNFRDCRECGRAMLRAVAGKLDQAMREARAECEREMEPLDADGVPIKPGDVVWHIDDEDGASPIRVESASLIRRAIVIDRSSGRFDYNPSTLTHKRPDSWGALEDDATRDPREYALRRGIKPGDVPAETMAADLVARAKKLAGVES